MAKEKTAEKAEASPAPENIEPKYRLDKLKANHDTVFGVTESIFIGATTGLAEGKEYSVSEIKRTIERWNAKEAK